MAENNNSIYAAAMQSAATVAGASFAAADSKAGRKWSSKEAQENRNFQREERLAVQEHNLDMWNLANEWNLAQWHRQNEYDSPQAQLERARAAGINPNTAIGSMYGGGSASLSASPVSSSPMSGSMASYSDGLPGAIMSSFSQLGVNTANMLNALAEKDTKEYWLSYDQATEGLRNKKLQADTEDILKAIDVKDVEIQTARVVLSNLSEFREQELENLRALAKKIESETRSTEAAIERDDRTADANIALVEQQTKQSEEQTESQSFINDFCKAAGAPVGTPEYLFLNKLYKENKLSDFLTEVYRRLEMTKWTPHDRIVPIEEFSEETYDTSSETGTKVLGVDNNARTNQKHNTSSRRRYYYYYDDNGQKTIINPHYQ